MLVGIAKQLGIQVILPPESDLMRPTTMYGIGEHNVRHIRIAERLKECEARKGALGSFFLKVDGQPAFRAHRDN